jgi:hypothetical protein
MVRARAIVAGQIPVDKGQLDHSKRMVGLPPMVIVDLERDEAPVHVFRWVAWGASPAEQRRRKDLVIYLRRAIARPRNGWFRERHFAAALAEWDRGRSEARKRGGIPPTHEQIPLDTYRAVIDAARKQPRTRSPEIEMSEEGEEGCESSMPEDEDEDDDEDDDDEHEHDDDQIEEEPISTRQSSGREHVLRHLSDAVRAAIAADDMEAAEAANDAISRLCGGREVSQ